MCGVRKFILSVALLLLSGKFVFAQPKIEIIYPKEGAQVIASDSTFIFGNISPKSAMLFINEKSVKVYPNGSFVAVVPVEPGNFTFYCQAVFEGTASSQQRSVYIPYYLKTSNPDSLVLDTSYVFPKKDWELPRGDVFKVAVKGTPGKKATFSIEGLINDLPMKELKSKRVVNWGEARFGQGKNFQMSEVEGIYTGKYFIQPWEKFGDKQVVFTLEDDSGKVIQTIAKGKISIDTLQTSKIAQLTKRQIRIKRSSGTGNQLFLPKEASFKVTGKRGEHVQIQISDNSQFWIKQDKLKILTKNDTLPGTVIREIRTENKKNWTSVQIFINQKLPFKIEQVLKPMRFDVTFYGTVSNIDSIRLNNTDPLIRNIRWEQKDKNIFIVKIYPNQKHHWGYDPQYINGYFQLNIKTKPEIAGWPYSPLKNIVICLDPGHNPDLGAVGPSGIAEKDINFEYCVHLKKELEKKGSLVLLTHDKNDGISIDERKSLAANFGADILLSLHFNGLPDGVNPFDIRGASTYYNQAQSYWLAFLIQQSILEKTKLPNFGLHFSTLGICTNPQMVTVLIEPGFLTIPLEEMLILTKSHKKKVVSAIVEALEQFLKESK